MRPLRLELEGFLSYREPTVVELEDLGPAVILGPNGAGKTSLVEAMSWALFAEGRGRGPDDFVSSGASSCRVSFEFELGGTRYRVERQRRSRKSYLGLFARNPSAPAEDFPGQWVPIGGELIAETQAAIERLLGMNARTWLTTSFIAQNRADQFSRMGAAERKELLMEVLDLTRYQARADVARERERAAAAEISVLERRAGVLADDLAAESGLREHHADALRIQDEAGRELADAQEQVATARRALDEVRESVAATRHAGERLEALRRSRREASARIRAELDRAEREADRLAGEVRQRESQIARTRASASLASDLEGELERRSAAVQGAQDVADRLAEQIADVEAQASAAAQRAGERRSAIDEVTERLELLRRADRGEAACYVCRQALEPDLRMHLITELEVQTHDLRTEHDAALIDEQANRAAADELRGQAAKARADLARAGEEANRAAAALERARADAERLRADEAAIEESRARLDEVGGLAERLRAEAVEREAPTHEEETLAAHLEDVRGLESKLAAAEAAVHRAEERERGLAGRVAQAAAAVGQAEAALEALERARAELADVQARTRGLAAARERYAYWSEGFGRDGIPALRVENALPEIEAEANHLLERLADGLHVEIESLRANKDGGLRETLDIRVADETAQRDLDEFSGGERQAVDLALRIAISRVLSARAGRPMETLILDEAFTAFDPGRRQRAIEVVHTLAQEFRTVLFVTHQSEFADAFGARILVSKNGTSRVEVATT